MVVSGACWAVHAHEDGDGSDNCGLDIGVAPWSVELSKQHKLYWSAISKKRKEKFIFCNVFA